MRAGRRFAAWLVLAAALMACGDDNGGATATADASDPVDAASADAATADAVAADAAAATADAAAVNATAGSDAGPRDAAVDAGADIDAADTSQGGVGVSCGADHCAPPALCCITGGLPPGGPSSSCTPADGCDGIPAACDGPEDCATGSLCCGSPGPTGTGATSCEAGSCQLELCHADDDCSQPDEICCESPFGIGAVCINPGFCF